MGYVKHQSDVQEKHGATTLHVRQESKEEAPTQDMRCCDTCSQLVNFQCPTRTPQKI